MKQSNRTCMHDYRCTLFNQHTALIKLSHLLFLLVTIECINKVNDFGTYKLHKATIGMMSILA